MKFDNTLLKVVQNDLKRGNIPMLLGEPGIGKSSWVKSLADINQTKCFTLSCNQLADKADLTGARMVPVYEPVLDANGQATDQTTITGYEQVFYPHAIIRRAIKYAADHPREEPILFMDELNRTTPDVTSECLSIPTDRVIGNTELPANLRVVTAGNDKGNITSLDEASISRFVLYHVEPDLPTFLKVNPNLNPFVKKVLEHNPETLLCKTIRVATGSDDDQDAEVDINEILNEGEEMNQFTTPRTLTSISEWLNSFTNDEILAMLSEMHVVNGENISTLEECLISHTGATKFTQLLISEIAQNVNQVTNQSNVLISEPNFWTEFKSKTTITDIQTYVNAMTEEDKGSALVYALYEKQDNTPFIQALAGSMTKIGQRYLRTFFHLHENAMIDDQNLQVLLNMQTNVSTTIGTLVGAI